MVTLTPPAAYTPMLCAPDRTEGLGPCSFSAPQLPSLLPGMWSTWSLINWFKSGVGHLTLPSYGDSNK